MKTTSSLVVVALACAGAAQATTYNYVGNPMHYNFGAHPDGAHLEIAAELNCTAPCAQGSYVLHRDLNQGMLSLKFSVFNADNTLRYSLSTSDPTFIWSSLSHKYLSETGAVQRWYLTGEVRNAIGDYSWGAKSVGFLDQPYWCGPINGCMQINDLGMPSVGNPVGMIANYDNPGTWSVEAPSPVPLPPAMSLFLGGLAILWGFGRRKLRVA